MSQTGDYETIEPEEVELEEFQENYQMIRPSFDFSAATYSKTEHLSWAEESAHEMAEREKLPTAVIRPDSPKVMRGITAGIGADLNSQPGQERIVDAFFDDDTIATDQASTAKLRRQSQYAPTTSTTTPKPTKIPLDRGLSVNEWAVDDASTISTNIYRPVQRPSDFVDQSPWDHEVSQEEPSINIEHNRWMHNGVYFPCFGILVPPLFGTEIFPLPPRQEKYHFNLVMDRPTGHYDGNPNGKYEDEIRRFMKTYLNTFNRTSLAFTIFDDLNESIQKWTSKFPFSSVRWGQTASASEYSVQGTSFRSVEQNPRLLDGAKDQLPRNTGNNQVSTTGAAQHNPVPPIRSKEILIDRQQRQDVQKLKDFLGNTDIGQSLIKANYDQFMKVVENFRKNGGKFKQPKNAIRKTISAVRDINSIEDMQKWLLQTQAKDGDFNAYHDDWANGPLVAKYYTTTHRIRLSGYMLTCLGYDHFMNIRDQVSHD